MTSLPNQGPDPSARPGAVTGANPVDPTKATGTASSDETAATGPAFRALLEQLQQKASVLQETSKDVADPAELRGAVDTARATLEDALSLGDQLLEAYRSAHTRGD